MRERCGTEDRSIEVGQARARRRSEPVTEAAGPGSSPETAPCHRVPTGARTATTALERVDAVPERAHSTLCLAAWVAPSGVWLRT